MTDDEGYEEALRRIQAAKETQAAELDLMELDLTELPASLCELTQLEELDISDNLFKEIPAIVFKLISLKQLLAFANQIEHISEEIGALIRLERMIVNNNKLTNLPRTLASLPNLKTLDIAYNHFDEIPAIVFQLSSLQELETEENQITHIPAEVLKLSNLRMLDIRRNPIANIPIEIANSRDVRRIFNYLRSLKAAENIEYLYEAKLVLVGRGYVGKTSLCRKLRDPDYILEDKIPSTESIDIVPWDLPMELEHSDQFRFNLWDFAGQEKYDSTHQFFLTERSLYLFVTDARQEGNYLDFDYWLNVVTLLSNNSPIIVVQNKIDERHKQLPSVEYQERFPNILNFVDVSCKTGQECTVDVLKQWICEGIKKLPQIGDKLPKSWVDIRNDIKDLTGKKDYISFEDYVKLCGNYGLTPDDAFHLSRYYHDLGIIVYYKDDLLLKDLVIINPDWAVDGAYAVLNAEVVQQNEGSFDDADLATIWREPRYRDKQGQLLALMKNYELCFELGSSKNYIIPNLLPANPVQYKALDAAQSMKFEIRYEFMPAGILTRLIVRLHRYIQDQAYWQQGMVIGHDDTRAEVLEKRMEKKVKIQLIGANCKGVLAIIRKELE
ncbi:MAG: GTP-binding protein, partial [Psychrosphaera sp.]|nr:GTP-binding protein [Psychrosphaera sp.]